MIKFLKQNRTFSICLLLTIIVFIVGLFFNAIIDDGAKKEITSNINNMILNMKQNKIQLFGSLMKQIFSDFSFLFLVWIFGISIVGIVVNLFLYLFKVFMFAFELVALLSNLHISNLFFILIYMLPNFLKLIVYFFMIYYSINYSLVLIKLLFFKRSFNIKLITQRYIKLLLICLLISLTISLLNGLFIPKILAILIK